MSEGDYQHCMVLVVGSSCYVRGRTLTLHGACSGEQLLCQRETTNTAWCL